MLAYFKQHLTLLVPYNTAYIADYCCTITPIYQWSNNMTSSKFYGYIQKGPDICCKTRVFKLLQLVEV